MKNIILSNAFSIQMLNADQAVNIHIEPLDLADVKAILSDGFTSAIGHVDTANVLTDALGIDVAFNRIFVKLDKNTVLVVAQLVGGRLPEGATTLPEGFSFRFFKVTII